MPRTSSLVPDTVRREIATALLADDRPSENALAERHGLPVTFVKRMRRMIGVPPIATEERLARMRAGFDAAGRPNGRAASPERREAIRTAYRSGATLTEVGVQFGISGEAVRRYVRDLIRERKAQQAARVALCHQEREARRAIHRELTDGEEEEVRRLRSDERLSIEAIARRYPDVPRTRIERVCSGIRTTPMWPTPGRQLRFRPVKTPMSTRRAIVRDHDAGMAYTQIANKHGVSEMSARNIVKRRDLIPLARAIGPVGRSRVNRPAARLTPQMHELITSLWLDGLGSADIADRLRAPRETVKAFAQKLKARGGWFSSVYVRECLRCRQPFVAQRRHARFHRRCAQALDGRQRRALRQESEQDDAAI